MNTADFQKFERTIRLRKQTNAFAMHYGMLFGLIWCISFFLLVSWNASLQLFFTPLFILTPVIGFGLAYKFKNAVKQDGNVGYGRALWFSIQLYLYATAIFAIIVYLYFQFLDGGRFISGNLEILSRPEVKSIFSDKAFVDAYGVSYHDVVNIMKGLTPIAIVSSIINFNIMLTIPLSIPTAFFALTKKSNLITS